MADLKRIMIDAGHGGSEPGALYMGRREEDDNLRLALEVGNILEQNGAEVAYTRTTDVYDTPLEKAMIGNRWGADYFISIHRNAMPVPGTGSGATTLVYENTGVPAMLAENIQKNLVNVGFADLGIQERPGIIVLRKTQMPAVLVEAGFIDNPKDNAFFDTHFQEIAQAIADGILETIREEEAARPEYYQIQVGAYRTRVSAEQLAEELQAKGIPAFLIYQDGYYKVRAGAFLNMDNAARMEQTLRLMGYPTMMVREPAVY
ncbi:MAG: N-acetylmuramoyl-L-alanine amidase [Enterocloster sp.]